MSCYDRLKEGLVGQCIASFTHLYEDDTYFSFITQTGEIFTFSSEGEVIDDDGDDCYIENEITDITLTLDEGDHYIGKRITDVVVNGTDSNIIIIFFGNDFIGVEFGEDYYGYMPISHTSRMGGF